MKRPPPNEQHPKALSTSCRRNGSQRSRQIGEAQRRYAEGPNAHRNASFASILFVDIPLWFAEATRHQTLRHQADRYGRTTRNPAGAHSPRAVRYSAMNPWEAPLTPSRIISCWVNKGLSEDVKNRLGNFRRSFRPSCFRQKNFTTLRRAWQELFLDLVRGDLCS